MEIDLKVMRVLCTFGPVPTPSRDGQKRKFRRQVVRFGSVGAARSWDRWEVAAKWTSAERAEMSDRVRAVRFLVLCG